MRAEKHSSGTAGVKYRGGLCRNLMAWTLKQILYAFNNVSYRLQFTIRSKFGVL